MKTNPGSANSELNDLIAEARARYDGLSPEDKADHDYEQRRSFVRGMCPGKRDYGEWCKMVDRLLPPRVKTVNG